MTATCETCRFWRHANGTSFGDCRRYAPRPAVWGSPQPPSWWAATAVDDGCGEHQPRQPAEAVAPRPDLAALTAERDRAIKACELTSKRITALEDVLLRSADEMLGATRLLDRAMHSDVSESFHEIIADARAALSGTAPRPRIDPETRRVLEAAQGGFEFIAEDGMTFGELTSFCCARINMIRAHLAKLDGEGGHG